MCLIWMPVDIVALIRQARQLSASEPTLATTTSAVARRFFKA